MRHKDISTKTNKLNDAAYDLADLLNSEQLDYSGGLGILLGGGSKTIVILQMQMAMLFL